MTKTSLSNELQKLHAESVRLTEGVVCVVRRSEGGAGQVCWRARVVTDVVWRKLGVAREVE